MSVSLVDPREQLAERLFGSGVDARSSFFIALDAGLGLVDRDYLVGIGLSGPHLSAAERIIMEFYWSSEAGDQNSE